MTLEQLVKALANATSLWDLNSIGLPAIKSGLEDAALRIQALEKAAKK